MEGKEGRVCGCKEKKEGKADEVGIGRIKGRGRQKAKEKGE